MKNKNQRKEYITPSITSQPLFFKGIICASQGSNYSQENEGYTIEDEVW